MAAYPGDGPRFFTAAGLAPPMTAPAGKPGTLLPLSPMLARAVERVSEPLDGISVRNPGDAASGMVVFFEEPKGLADLHPQVAFDGTTGALAGTAGTARPVMHASTAFVGLHEAYVAGAVLRASFFLCGVMGTAAVATGLVLWSVARGPDSAWGRCWRSMSAPSPACPRVSRSTSWPTVCFRSIWRSAPPGRSAPSSPPGRWWREGLGLAALLFLAIPVVDALTIGRPVLGEGLRFLGFDAGMIVLELLLAFAAGRAFRRLATPAAARLRERIGAGEEALRASRPSSSA